MSISSFTRQCKDTIQVMWERFNNFAADLFGKLSTKFQQNLPSFVVFFSGHRVHLIDAASQRAESSNVIRRRTGSQCRYSVGRLLWSAIILRGPRSFDRVSCHVTARPSLYLTCVSESSVTCSRPTCLSYVNKVMLMSKELWQSGEIW